MIDSLIRFSIHNRTIVLALALAFLIWGGYSISKMPVDVLPDLSCAYGDHSGRGPGNGADRDGVARNISDRIRSERRRWCSSGSVGDSCGRRCYLGGIRLGAGHPARPPDRNRKTQHRIGIAAVRRRNALSCAGLVHHGRDSLHRARIAQAFSRGTANRMPKRCCVAAFSPCRAFRR